jgi:hypothetical protein
MDNYKKATELKIKKKYKKNIKLYYRKTDLTKDFVVNSDNTFDVNILATKLYDKKFKNEIGNLIYNTTYWKAKPDELVQEYTTIFLQDGTITFFSPSTNIYQNKRYVEGNIHIWKINSGTDKYLDIKGYVVISIVNEIRKVNIYYRC